MPNSHKHTLLFKDDARQVAAGTATSGWRVLILNIEHANALVCAKPVFNLLR